MIDRIAKYSFRPRALVLPDARDIPNLNLLYVALVPGFATAAGSISSILLIGSALWAYLQMARGLSSVSRSAEIRLICAFYAAFYLSEVLAAAINFHGFRTISGLVGNVLFLLLFPLTCAFKAKKQDMIAFLEGGAVIFSFFSVACASIQFFMLGLRAEGAAGNPGVFAILCAVLYGINLIAIFHGTGRRRLIFLAAATAAAIALLLSGMRALWPCVAVLPLIVFFIYRRQVSRRFLLAGVGVGALAVALTALFLRQLIESRFLLTMLEIDSISNGNLDTSIGYRISLWHAGWSMFLEKPIFGWGPGDFMDVLKQKTVAYAGYPVTFSHFHNVFLNAAVRSGLIGVVTLVLCVAAPIYLAARHARDAHSRYGFALVSCTIAAFVISGLTGIMFWHDILVSNFMALMSVSLVLSYREEDVLPSPEGP